MTEIFQYDKIVKYKVTAECTQPMHIGNGENDRAQVLVHPVDGIPFIQASSISGVFRDCYTKLYGKNEAEQIFGKSSGKEEDSMQSRIRISDGTFYTGNENLTIELRPRVRINRKTGTVDNSVVQGSGKDSGQKFNMEYIGAGAQFTFSIYLYGKDDTQNRLEDVFSAINQQKIQFGGQQSNGCGYLKLKGLLYKEFHMKNKNDRKLWMMEEILQDEIYTDRLEEISQTSSVKDAYEIIVTGRTQGELLVKSISVSDYGKDAPYSVNIRNAKKEYIIPGSSFKGCIRNQMQQIADYLDLGEIINDTFGIPADGVKNGNTGNIRFFDTVVGTIEGNDSNRLSHRIHIDKFTGGVMHGGLFTEKNIFGNLTLHIRILNKNNPDRTLGLLLLALRDLASGLYGIGSGSNVGHGFLTLDLLTIKNGDGAQAQICFTDNKIKDDNSMIKSCLRAVRGN
ncbi:MAG: hypothetical protein K2L07_13630 [Lachnospiraceae bacterium]|nr:hypothetical protein [Lachnospiraceae bacterium]